MLLNVLAFGIVFGQTSPAPKIVGATPAESAKKPPADLSALVGLKVQTAPAFALSSMNGTGYDLEKMRGQIVVVNLWATFCPPCIEEMPGLNALVEKFKGKAVVFLAPTPDDKAVLETFLRKYPFDYQVLPNGFKVVEKYAPHKKSDDPQKKGAFLMLLPTHLVIDRTGVVTYHEWGFRKDTIDEISGEITRLLTEDEHRRVENPDESEKAAIEILEKNVKAVGGRDALARIKSIEIQSELAVLGRTVKVRRISDVAGNRSVQRQDSGGGGGIIETGFDGKRAWQKAAHFRGYLEASNPQAKSLMRGGVNLPGANLYNYQSSGRKFARLADEPIGGVNYSVVKSGYADETGRETAVKYYFDPKTFLIKQIVTGNAVTQTEIFDDYRKVGDLTIAFASTVTTPQVSLVSKIIELKFNVPVSDSLFEFEETNAQPTPKVSGEPRKIEVPGQIETDGEPAESIRLETFERVWKKVNDTFYDRTFNGVNWQAVHDRYLPAVKTTVKSNDFHELLNRMVQELHLSHFKVVPPNSVVTLSSGAANLNGGAVGLSLQWIDNQMLVSAVEKDSPAESAKIRPGFIVNKINGKTPDELYAEYKKTATGFQFREELARVRAAGKELSGKVGAKINLELTGESETVLKSELLLKPRSAVRQLEFESKKLVGDIGYIKFNFFFGDLLTKFQTALQEMKTARALIIDLRGNPGGAGDLAPALANLLCEKAGSLGSLQYRYETQQYSYRGSGAQAFRGKVILLTDAGTGSTAEVLAGGLQANQRAVVIGSPSAGAVLPSLVELLPTGGALQYVVANFQTPNKIALEGKGVIPDSTIKSTRAALLAGRDIVLEQALSHAEK